MKIPAEKPAHFCIAPFQSIRQDPFGRNSPCAFGAGEWNHGELTPEERWNSTELNALRQEFVNGEKPSACRRCWDEEKAGKKSLRERTLEYFPDDYEKLIQTGQWQKGPKTAVFKTSNICNLACRSCAGWDTSLYAREGQHYLKTYETTAPHEGGRTPHNRFIPLRPPRHLDFKPYAAIAENLTKLDFFGGEPFLNTTHLDLLEHLIETGRSRGMTLFYSTNGTTHPSERLQKAWAGFQEVQISFSVDGIAAGFEYLRWPGKWQQLQNVIDGVLNLRATLPLKIMGSLTISAINAFEADRLTAWHEERFGRCYINMVQSPDYLSVHILPENVKAALRREVRNSEVLGYIDIAPPDPFKFKQFIIWMKRQDRYRSQDFAAFFPAYHSLFAAEWKALEDLGDANFQLSPVFTA